MNKEDMEKLITASIDNIKDDKARLNNIINAINSGDLYIDINDRLINKLNGLQFSDPIMGAGIEYLTLILSNLESQKINSTKTVTEELIKILSHNLEMLNYMEMCLRNSVKENQELEELIKGSPCQTCTHAKDHVIDKEATSCDINSDKKVDKTHNHELDDSGITEMSRKDRIHAFLYKLLPHTDTSNIIFYALIFMLVIYAMYEHDNNSLTQIEKTAIEVKTGVKNGN